MKYTGKKFRFVFITFFSFVITFPVISQGTESAAQKDTSDFFLLPILEVVFSQNVKWRPDYPSYFPPDGFVTHEKIELIELSNGDESFIVKYDKAGRLLEFPFFYNDSYAQINASYTETGALSRMTVTLKNYSSGESNQSDEKIVNITFPNNFLPFSQISPGGEFPPISIRYEDTVYHVFIFESPVFLTETWFDSEGNILFFCKASVNVDNGKWRIRAMELQDINGAQFVDFYFDSYGNITEIKIQDGVFISLYNENLPNYLRYNDLKYELFWDTQNVLQIIKASEFIDEIYTEYRYEYDFDDYGNWIKRRETAYIISSNLLVPDPSYSRGIWVRRIIYFE